MKPFIKVMILALVCILVILMGCAKKDHIASSEPGFNNSLLKEINLEVAQQATFTEFKDELEQFKLFSDEFFPIWSEHINRSSSMVDEFNSSTILEEKLICSGLLAQSYLDFQADLESIKPPAIAAQAYDLAVEVVSYRALFFKKFNQNAPVDQLNELEGKAYIAEASFWDEIDRIYDYFDEEMASIDTADDNKYIVFK